MNEPNQEKCERLMDEVLAREISFEQILYEQSLLEESNNLKRKVSCTFSYSFRFKMTFSTGKIRRN